MKRVLAGVVVLFLLSVACGEADNPNAACSEALARDQNEVGHRAVDETAFAASTIEGALDNQKEGGLAADQERTLRGTQRRLRSLSRDLDVAFNTGCM